MRHDFHSRWELGSLNVYAWLGRVPVQDCVLRSRANRRFELYLIRKFNDGLGALRVSSHRNSCDEQHDPKVRNAHYFLPYRCAVQIWTIAQWTLPTTKDRTPTREAAMTAFAKSWRRE